MKLIVIASGPMYQGALFAIECNCGWKSKAHFTVEALHLDSAPQVALQSDISQLQVAGSAISGDGTLPVVLSGTGAAYLLQPNNRPAAGFQVDAGAGLGFLPNQQVLAITDGAGSTITLLDGLASLPFPRVVTPCPALSSSAIFVQGSSNGKSEMVSGADAENVYRADLTTQTLSAVALPERVSRFVRLQGIYSCSRPIRAKPPAATIGRQEPVDRFCAVSFSSQLSKSLCRAMFWILSHAGER